MDSRAQSLRQLTRCAPLAAIALQFCAGCGGRSELDRPEVAEVVATCENGLAEAAGPAPLVSLADTAPGRGSYGYGLAALEGGDFVWIGNYTETLKLGTVTLTAEDDATFLARVSPDGTVRWARSLPTEGFYSPSVSARDGIIVVSCTIDRDGDFGQGLIVAQKLDPVVAAFDALDGSLLWAKNYGGPTDDYGGPVAQGCDGTIWAARVIAWKIEISRIRGREETDVFKPEGNGLTGLRRLVPVQDLLLVAGDFYGRLDLGGITLQAGFSGSGFVALLDSAGRARWAEVVGGQARAAATVGTDLYVVAGVHTEPWSLQGHTFGVEGRLTSFVVGFDDKGSMVAFQQFAGSDWTSVQDLAPSPQGVAVTGAYTGELRVGDFRFVYAGPEYNQDLWVARLAPDLAVLGAEAYGGKGPDDAKALLVDTLGRPLVTGFTEGNYLVAGAAMPKAQGAVVPFVVRLP